MSITDVEGFKPIVAPVEFLCFIVGDFVGEQEVMIQTTRDIEISTKVYTAGLDPLNGAVTNGFKVFSDPGNGCTDSMQPEGLRSNGKIDVGGVCWLCCFADKQVVFGKLEMEAVVFALASWFKDTGPANVRCRVQQYDRALQLQRRHKPDLE